MIIIWLIVWAICSAPSVHPWNAWFITLIIALVLSLGHFSIASGER